MATAVVGRRLASDRRVPTSLYRASYSFLRTLSTFGPVSPAPSTPKPKPTKKKGSKNLFEVAHFLPDWGIGYHMAKKHWGSLTYQITKINLHKCGNHGKAWGIRHKDGVPVGENKKISGVNKRCWCYIPNLPKTLSNIPEPKVPESQAEAA